MKITQNNTSDTMRQRPNKKTSVFQVTGLKILVRVGTDILFALRLTHDVIFVANSLYTFEELSVKSVNHDVSKVKLTSKFSKRAEKKQITS